MGLLFKVIGMNSILIYMSGNFLTGAILPMVFQMVGAMVGNPNNIVYGHLLCNDKMLFLYLWYKKKVFESITISITLLLLLPFHHVL